MKKVWNHMASGILIMAEDIEDLSPEDVIPYLVYPTTETPVYLGFPDGELYMQEDVEIGEPLVIHSIIAMLRAISPNINALLEEEMGKHIIGFDGEWSHKLASAMVHGADAMTQTDEQSIEWQAKVEAEMADCPDCAHST
jgi:hypothetical protein